MIYFMFVVFGVLVGVVSTLLTNSSEMTYQRSEGYKEGQADYKKSLVNSPSGVIIITENENMINERERWFRIKEINPSEKYYNF